MNDITVASKHSSMVATFMESLNSNTLRAYSKALDDFSRHLGVKSVGEAASALLSNSNGEANGIVLSYQTSLKAKGLSPSTINVRINAIRSLARMARMLGLIQWKIDIRNIPSKSYRDTRGCGEEGYRAMLKSLPKSESGIRDEAILRLCWRGVRRNEIATMQLSDFDAKEERVRILGKGRTEHEWLTVGKETIAAINKWISVRGDQSGALFTSLDTGHSRRDLAETGVYQIIKRIGKNAGVERARPHGIRHASITAALDKGIGIREVAQFARHAKIDTTIRYDDNRADFAGQVARTIE